MELRYYQKSGNRRIKEAWKRVHRVLAVAPTGAGKGTMAVALIRDALRQKERVLFLVHRREIVEDIVQRIRGVSRARVGVILSGYERDLTAPVQVASVQSLCAVKAGRFDVVIADEAHHYRADEWWAVLERVGKQARIVGFTATPQRADGKAMGDVFEELVDVVSYSELLERGHIVPCRVLRPPYPLDGDLAQEPLKAYLRYANRSSALVFVSTIAHAKDAQQTFEAAGVTVGIVHAKTPHKERKRLVKALQSSDIDVIINVHTMTEGVDLPGVTTVILARTCQHATTYMQIAGRALRPFAGKKGATLLDLAGASYRHGIPTTDRTYSLLGREPIAFAGSDVAILKALISPQRGRGILGLELVEYSGVEQRKHGKRIVDWAAVGFGEKTDRQIARETGISESSVQVARSLRGIPTVARRLQIDWDAVPLGTATDTELAAQLGCSEWSVNHARVKRGISPSKWFNWDSQPLGQITDAALARRLGCSRREVTAARNRRGIAPLVPHSLVDWKSEKQLGVLSDREMAEKHGISIDTARAARLRRIAS